MSIPVPVSQERQSVDQNQRQIARATLTLVENLIAFNEFVSGFTDQQLTDPPYGYTAEQIYSMRRYGETGAAWALIFSEGGTLAPADSDVFEEITRKSAGVIVYQPTGF